VWLRARDGAPGGVSGAAAVLRRPGLRASGAAGCSGGGAPGGGPGGPRRRQGSGRAARRPAGCELQAGAGG
jgi:hypothetical protein